MCREASISFGSKLIVVIIILTFRSVCKSKVKEFVCINIKQGIELFHFGFEASTIRVSNVYFVLTL